jgi:hypothetical protein
MINEVLPRHKALGTPLLKEHDHVNEWFRDTLQECQLLLKCPPLPGREREQVLNAPSFLFRKDRIAVRIVERRYGHAPLEILRLAGKRSGFS